MSETVVDSLSKALDAKGSTWAEVGDAVKAVLRVACDDEVSGRAFGVMPRGTDGEGEGFADLGVDDYEGESVMGRLQGVVNGTVHRSLPADRQ